MKVFKFDPATGKKGEQIADIPRPDAISNRNAIDCVLPKNTDSITWSTCTKIENRKGDEITFSEPVCFCHGLWRAGTNESWEWYALVPTK